MRQAAHLLIITVFLFLSGCSCNPDLKDEGLPPEIQKEAKPWAYWWWMGSAVTREDLTRVLETYREAGLGGVHVIPIYGVRGQEDRFIPFLSEEWMEMLAHTVADVATGLRVAAMTGGMMLLPETMARGKALPVRALEPALERGGQLPWREVVHFDRFPAPDGV